MLRVNLIICKAEEVVYQIYDYKYLILGIVFGYLFLGLLIVESLPGYSIAFGGMARIVFIRAPLIKSVSRGWYTHSVL